MRVRFVALCFFRQNEQNQQNDSSVCFVKKFVNSVNPVSVISSMQFFVFSRHCVSQPISQKQIDSKSDSFPAHCVFLFFVVSTRFSCTRFNKKVRFWVPLLACPAVRLQVNLLIVKTWNNRFNTKSYECNGKEIVRGRSLILLRSPMGLRWGRRDKE